MIFLTIGIVIYFSYGLWHSNLEADNVTRGQLEESLVLSEMGQGRERGLTDQYMPPQFNKKDSSDDESEYHLKITGPLVKN
jgi:hypothetical protein